MPEINPSKPEQMKKYKVVKIIDARDKVEYELTAKAPSVGTKDKPGKESVGAKHWGHPNVVEKFVSNGWAKLTGEQKTHKMPEPVEK